MAREPLTSEERRLLTDPEALAEATRRAPVVIQQRQISGLTIPDLTFVNVRFTDVEFREVAFDRTTFLRCSFDDVAFVGCDLSMPVLRESEMVNVTMSTTRFREARFERCGLTGVRSSLCQFDRPVMIDSRVNQLHDKDGEILDASFTGVVLANATLVATAFRRPVFERVAFEGGRLTRVKMTLVEARRLTLQRVDLDGLEIEGGRAEELALIEVAGLGFRASDVDLQSLQLSQAGPLANFIVAGGTTRGFVIDRCPTLEMLVLGYCDISGLRVNASGISGLFVRNSRLAAGGLFQACALDGVQISETEAEELTLRDVTIASRLDVSGSRFVGLHLEQVQYSPPLTVVDGGVTYRRGDAFPAR